MLVPSGAAVSAEVAVRVKRHGDEPVACMPKPHGFRKFHSSSVQVGGFIEEVNEQLPGDSDGRGAGDWGAPR